ncbi:MAG: DNA starvation/stationary phase protection protein Dps [Chloroflexi bacterium]|nr:DNA starvation/stationary phase protection protein Dps [Chloroflexota bacterium]
MEKTKLLHSTSVHLDEATRVQMIDLLNQHLADMFDLYSQTKQAHWNVKGMNFIQLHELFDELAATVLPFVDEIAERVTALGGVALGTARLAAANTRLTNMPTDLVTGQDFVTALVDRFAFVANNCREAFDDASNAGDEATADLFIEMTRTLDKNLYFLESHLQA